MASRLHAGSRAERTWLRTFLRALERESQLLYASRKQRRGGPVPRREAGRDGRLLHAPDYEICLGIFAGDDLWREETAVLSLRCLQCAAFSESGTGRQGCGGV